MKWTELWVDKHFEEMFQPTAKMFYIVAGGCKSFCKQWRDNNGEQVECLTGQKIRLLYCNTIGPKQYDLSFAIGKNKVINWFGSACCSYCAVAKAYQSFYDECY